MNKVKKNWTEFKGFFVQLPFQRKGKKSNGMSIGPDEITTEHSEWMPLGKNTSQTEQPDHVKESEEPCRSIPPSHSTASTAEVIFVCSDSANYDSEGYTTDADVAAHWALDVPFERLRKGSNTKHSNRDSGFCSVRGSNRKQRKRRVDERKNSPNVSRSKHLEKPTTSAKSDGNNMCKQMQLMAGKESSGLMYLRKTDDSVTAKVDNWMRTRKPPLNEDGVRGRAPSPQHANLRKLLTDLIPVVDTLKDLSDEDLCNEIKREAKREENSKLVMLFIELMSRDEGGINKCTCNGESTQPAIAVTSSSMRENSKPTSRPAIDVPESAESIDYDGYYSSTSLQREPAEDSTTDSSSSLAKISRCVGDVMTGSFGDDEESLNQLNIKYNMQESMQKTVKGSETKEVDGGQSVTPDAREELDPNIPLPDSKESLKMNNIVQNMDMTPEQRKENIDLGYEPGNMKPVQESEASAPKDDTVNDIEVKAIKQNIDIRMEAKCAESTYMTKTEELEPVIPLAAGSDSLLLDNILQNLDITDKETTQNLQVAVGYENGYVIQDGEFASLDSSNSPRSLNLASESGGSADGSAVTPAPFDFMSFMDNSYSTVV